MHNSPVVPLSDPGLGFGGVTPAIGVPEGLQEASWKLASLQEAWGDVWIALGCFLEAPRSQSSTTHMFCKAPGAPKTHPELREAGKSVVKGRLPGATGSRKTCCLLQGSRIVDCKLQHVSLQSLQTANCSLQACRAYKLQAAAWKPAELTICKTTNLNHSKLPNYDIYSVCLAACWPTRGRRIFSLVS